MNDASLERRPSRFRFFSSNLVDGNNNWYIPSPMEQLEESKESSFVYVDPQQAVVDEINQIEDLSSQQFSKQRYTAIRAPRLVYLIRRMEMILYEMYSFRYSLLEISPEWWIEQIEKLWDEMRTFNYWMENTRYEYQII